MPTHAVSVHAIAHCPHVSPPPPEAVVSAVRASGEAPACSVASGEACLASGEVWQCLSCPHRGCGRYAAAHASSHAEAAGHSLALGFADLSVWCYACSAYLDVFRIPALHAVFAAAHEVRFGEPPALPGLTPLNAAGGGGRAAGGSS